MKARYLIVLQASRRSGNEARYWIVSRASRRSGNEARYLIAAVCTWLLSCDVFSPLLPPSRQVWLGQNLFPRKPTPTKSSHCGRWYIAQIILFLHVCHIHQNRNLREGENLVIAVYILHGASISRTHSNASTLTLHTKFGQVQFAVR